MRKPKIKPHPCPMCGGSGVASPLEWVADWLATMTDDTRRAILGYLIGLGEERAGKGIN